MIVLASTHQKLKAEYVEVYRRFNDLKHQWNCLVDRINRKGGEEFLQSEGSPFSQDEIRTLVKLCHPDKHGGSKDAEQITTKLLTLRKR